ncbi:hypothetical protein TRFO_16899 [Tritrichomonas foetus]|uniref:Uncharacterized protein n=1 Tax=Tritrichomonas foetus TaxID=1144522 RepID=A0A1J4KTP5_9EUKA|nr:hypothetical protein TRFO_16899 [Tritrichomonas foetus]|eukprot:OHT13132.1 hypothetical protein TRFO_16899 [Tritrichomonas foetus]
MENKNSLSISSNSDSSSESSAFREVQQPKSSFKNPDLPQKNIDKKDRPRVVIEPPHIEENNYYNEPRFQHDSTPSFTAFFHLKKELDRFKKLAEDRQISVLSADTKVREVESKLDEANIKLRQYEAEIQSLKGDSSSSSHRSTSSNGVNSTFTVFQEILDQNSEQMNKLSESRIQLIGLCNRYQQCLDFAESIYQNAFEVTREKDPLIILRELFASILDIISPTDEKDSSISEPDDAEGYKDRILNIVQTLFDEKGFSNSGSSSRSSSRSGSQISSENDDLILGHLENALHFIRTLEKTGIKEPPLKDCSLKDLINEQCKQIEEFLKTNKPKKVASIFGDSDSVEEQINTFYELASKENINESPIRELFSLFTGAIEVNKILFDRNRLLEKEYQKLRRQNKEEKDKSEANKSELEAKEKQINKTNKTISKALGHEIENTESGINEFMELLASSTDIIKDKDSQIAKLKKALANSKKVNSISESQLKAKDKHIAQLMNKLNSSQYEKESENTELQNKLNEATKKLEANQNIQAELEKAQKRLQKYHKQGESTTSLTQQLQEAQEQNAVLQNQLAKITEQMDNYQASSDFTASTMSGYETHISSLKGKMASLRRRNAELESQLHGALEDIKMRNDKLEKSYKKQISMLNNQLEKLRGKYAEVKDMNEQSKKWREDYYTQMAKMRVVEKKLEAEARDAKEMLKIGIQQNEARLESQKVAFQAKIEEENKKQAKYTQKLARAIEVDSDELSVLIDAVVDRYDAKIINDAYDTKQKLNLNPKSRISDAVDDLLDQMNHLEKLLNDNDKDACQHKSSKSLNFQDKSHSDKARNNSECDEENLEWRNWANDLYSKLNDGEIAPVNTNETKSSIQKAIYAIKSPQSNERKYNILKAEKSILNKFDSKSLSRMKGKKPTESIRPLILAIMFSKKIEGFTLPTDLPFLTEDSTSNSMTSD